MKSTEPLVPLSDCYGVVGAVDDVAADYLARSYGVRVLRDHANRYAVSLADAYRIRDARLSAEAEIATRTEAENALRNAVRRWQDARDSFWERNWIGVRRSIPYDHNGGNQDEAINKKARQVIAERVIEAEAAAGIDPEVQKRLHWPAWGTTYMIPDPGADLSYQPPKEP